MNLSSTFLEKSFEMNDASILQALTPVIASQVSSESEFADACRDYLRQYGEHLTALSERDLTVALATAAKVIKAQSGE